MNALFFSSGHIIQAMDCNMGIFLGECFKVPFLIREFFPGVNLKKYRDVHGKRYTYLENERDALEASRSAPRGRFLGFREHIFTGRDGTVGAKHANADFTFGTIYQRSLATLGACMRYGHPDFLDSFWTRNRGGTSKCSPTVNLSADLFAGYTVRMREELSPHYGFLKYEKGREATFNAASGLFSKVSGGAVAVLRSRDNNLLCERLGVLNNLSFSSWR